MFELDFKAFKKWLIHTQKYLNLEIHATAARLTIQPIILPIYIIISIENSREDNEHNVFLTRLEMSVFEVVDGVAQQPAGPVDDVDGGGENVLGGGEVVDISDVHHGDVLV